MALMIEASMPARPISILSILAAMAPTRVAIS
jgi:hypothetical protein